MRDTQSKVIDGETYEIIQLPATKALRLVPRLGSLIGPVLAQLSEVNADADASALGAVASALFDKLTPDELEVLAGTLLNDLARVDGKPLWPIRDLHFQGRIMTWFKVLIFAVQVNFGDFFDGLRGLSAGSPQAPSPSTSANG